MVGCRNTSTNYRETGIRGHPEAHPRAPQTSSLPPSLRPRQLIKPEIPAFQPLDFMEEIDRERERDEIHDDSTIIGIHNRTMKKGNKFESI